VPQKCASSRVARRARVTEPSRSPFARTGPAAAIKTGHEPNVSTRRPVTNALVSEPTQWARTIHDRQRKPTTATRPRSWTGARSASRAAVAGECEPARPSGDADGSVGVRPVAMVPSTKQDRMRCIPAEDRPIHVAAVPESDTGTGSDFGNRAVAPSPISPKIPSAIMAMP
jgi:hypothetical protein